MSLLDELEALRNEVEKLKKENSDLSDQCRPLKDMPKDQYELLRLLDRRQLEIARLTGQQTLS